jgi:hypothetical protein
MERSEPGTQQGKRPYETPAVVSERIFETTALACGKKTGEACKCMGQPKAS